MVYSFIFAVSEDTQDGSDPGDQRAGITDPEESSPSMIVYRKVRHLVERWGHCCVSVTCGVDGWLDKCFLPKWP